MTLFFLFHKYAILSDLNREKMGYSLIEYYLLLRLFWIPVTVVAFSPKHFPFTMDLLKC